MARILNVEVPNNKRSVVALTYIKGIGPTVASKILKEANINPNTRIKDFSEEELVKLRKTAESYLQANDLLVEGELRREVSLNIKRLMEIKAYRGLRHRKGLPVRGQCTQKNARTRKGPRKTVAGKKGKK